MPKEQKLAQEERKTDRPLTWNEAMLSEIDDEERLREIKKRVAAGELFLEELPDKTGFIIKNKEGKPEYFETYKFYKTRDSGKKEPDEASLSQEELLDAALEEYKGPEQ